MRHFICRWLWVCFLSGMGAMEAATLRVPTGYTNIQSAINAAGTGDVVLVAPGTFFENISFAGKAITVMSLAGPAATILDGRRAGPVVAFGTHETRNSILSGFTLRNGYADYGSGISLSDASATIVGNVFESNQMVGGRWGAAIGGNTASPVVERNIFRHNSTDLESLSGVVSFINECSPRIANNLFYDNTGRAINLAVNLNARPIVINNTIVRNQGSIRARTFGTDTFASFFNNIVSANTVGFEVDGRPPIVWMNNLVGGNGTDYAGIADQTGTNGNISGLPAFQPVCFGATDEFRLQSGSPGIDAGNNSAPQLPATDLDGQVRILTGQSNGVPVVDIGAYEFDPSVPVRICPGPRLTLVGPDPLTNECHVPFVDPGVTVHEGPVAVSAGNDCNVALKADGRLVQWGFNPQNILTIPISATNIVAVAASEGYMMGLRRDGMILAWGHRLSGQTNVPAHVTNVVKIVGAPGRGLAIRADGSLVGWGSSSFGETNVPPHVTDVVSAGTGFYHVVAANAQGNVFAWGRGLYGTTNVPVAATNVVSVAVGAYHNLALRANGTIVGWGAGATNRGDYPDVGQTIIPAGATNVVAISSTAYHCLALKADGTVVAWGLNNRGQINVPPGTSNVVAVSAGAWHSLLLKADGSVIGLGDNDNDSISIPTNLTTVELPVTVSGSVDVNVPGTYQLTYKATNILGEVGTAMRTVVVTDTIPPTILCPTNLNVELMSSAGAAVFFAVQATDLCSGGVGGLSTPPSGSVFPVGTTLVTCVATDAAGNVTQCNFEVTVLGALSIKRAVLSEMETLRASLAGKRLAELNRAISKLRRSTNANWWLDELHLKRTKAGGVFWNEAATVYHLRKLLRARRDEIPDETLQHWIDRLVGVDRALADVQIQEAIAVGANPKSIALASSRLSRGDLAASHGQSVRAIRLYRDAWRAASRALARIQTQ